MTHDNSRRRTQFFVAAACCLGLLGLSACGGSAMSPASVLAANRAVSGQGGGDAGAPTGTTDTTAPLAGGQTAATGGSTTPGSTGGGAPPPAAVGGGGTPAPGAGASGGSGKGAKGATTKPSAAAGATGADCTGFQNGTGVTDSTITVANIADISGPVPGLFTSAQQATKAFVAYFNSTSNICGRKLSVEALDSATDAGGAQRATTTACQNAFAAVGNMSAYDSGGASTAQGCGLPEIIAAPVTKEINACTTCFGALSSNASQFQNAIPDFFVKNYSDSTKAAAVLYLNAGAAVQNAATQMAVEKQRGMNIVYSASIDVSDFNYGPYVQAMKDKGVKWVQMLGPYQDAARMLQAMQQAGFKPDFFVVDASDYNPDFIKQAGATAKGVVSFINFTPFEEAGNNPEMQLYRTWLNQVAPGAAPTFFGLYAWSAARLFTEQAQALGGKLNRASLVQALSKVQNWADHGLHSPQNVGAKTVAPCARFLQYNGSAWVPFGGTAYTCTGVTTVGN